MNLIVLKNTSFRLSMLIIIIIIISGIYIVFTFSSNWNPLNKSLSRTVTSNPNNNNLPQATKSQKIVTVQIGGQLGNIIWEYLSIIAIAKRFINLQASMPKMMKEELQIAFDK